MNIFTSGYELTTAITNLFILFSALFAYIKLFKKDVDKLWKLFFLFIVLDGFLGFIIHGILLSEKIISILWIILSLLFCITVNILLAIFIMKKGNIKFIILSSIFVYSILLIETIFNIDFLLTYIIYVALCMFVILFINIKYKRIYNILAIILQFIGGIFLIFKINFNYLDKNGIYHLFMVCTVVLFYLNAKKELNC